MKRRVGLKGDQADIGVELTQPATDAHEGATRAEARDEVRDAPFGLFPDLRRGGLVVRLPVGGIVVLVGIEVPIGVFGGQFAGFEDRAVGGEARIRQDQFGPIGAEQVFALLVGVARQAEVDFVAHRCAEHGVGDAGVARGRIENDLAGSE